MARIYILEPEADVRELFVRVADRLGLEAREYEPDTPPQLEHDDVLVVEPADPSSLQTALEASQRLPSLRIVCVSVYSSIPETVALKPHAYIVKPFRLEELERALRAATEL
jgi:AmiR/NasT family two-component response regulator